MDLGMGTTTKIKELKREIEEPRISEADLESLARHRNIEMGSNIKTRLNYYVTLGILERPKPVYFGKGKGGTRLFQKDAVNVLEYVQKHRDNFSFNEIAEIIKERREDLQRQAKKELDYENRLPEINGWLLAVPDPFAEEHIPFRYQFIKGQVLIQKITDLEHAIDRLDKEIMDIGFLEETLKQKLCEACGKAIEEHIAEKFRRKEELSRMLDEATEAVMELIERMK
jgi:DNA-binding transcriptional MerR regulator